MRAVVQRVKKASVSVSDNIISDIGRGLLVFIAFKEDDTESDTDYIIKKIQEMRIYPDSKDVMNLSIKDYEGEILIVSQFTLYGDMRKGRRPSYSKSMKPEPAKLFYDKFIKTFKERTELTIKTGEFGADMDVSIENWGPITILLDSEKNF